MFDEDVWTIVILLDKEFDVVRPAGVRLVARVEGAVEVISGRLDDIYLPR